MRSVLYFQLISVFIYGIAVFIGIREGGGGRTGLCPQADERQQKRQDEKSEVFHRQVIFCFAGAKVAKKWGVPKKKSKKSG